MQNTEEETKPDQTADRATLKAHLVKALRATGHVAEHSLEAVAETALSIALAGRFGS